MATISMRTDDITGETLPEDTPTTQIHIDDPRGYLAIEIDLNNSSFKSLQEALSQFYDSGRVIPPTPTKRPGAGATEASEERRDARVWALAHPDLLPEGVQANEKGKVSNAVIDAYRTFLAEGHASEEAINE